MTVDPDEAPVFVKLKLAKDRKKLARLAVHIGSLDGTRGSVGDRFLAAVRKAVVPEHGVIVKTWRLEGFRGKNPGCLMEDGVEVAFRGVQVLNFGKYKAV